MVKEQKISGLLVLSEPEWGCYPYIESIKSFLPALDELVISFNVYGKDDGSRAKIEAIGDPKIRIIPTIFDIEKYGWISYGVARTMGYQACTGDIILMFDADGILHENDLPKLNEELVQFIDGKRATGYWNKYRTYKPDLYYNQYKHSGIYSKKLLGDRMDFMRASGKGAPNFSKLTPQEQASFKFSIFLFGYEHVWDTKEVLKFKVNRYGRMIDKLHNKPFKTPEQYFDEYMRALVDKVNKEGKTVPISEHPSIMQEKLKSVNETHFGHNFFGYK